MIYMIFNLNKRLSDRMTSCFRNRVRLFCIRHQGSSSRIVVFDMCGHNVVGVGGVTGNRYCRAQVIWRITEADR